MNKEIIEGNKLIAQFMGIETKVYSDTPTVTLWNFDGFMRQENDMKYDTSWDWLMPVVEKIESMGTFVSINGKSCGIWNYFDMSKVLRKNDDSDGRFTVKKTGKSKIEATWQTIIDFINFYNQQTETTSQEKQS